MRFAYCIIVIGLFICMSMSIHSIIISEVRPDPAGPDQDREWVEIYNNGSTAVNLSDWRFIENNVSHLLSLVTGSWSIASGDAVVLADTPETVIEDFTVNGTVLDTAWGSLHNNGELIGMQRPNETPVDAIAYPPATENLSVCRHNASGFVLCNATPGTVPTEDVAVMQENTEAVEENNNSAEQHNNTQKTEEQQREPVAKETQGHRVLNTTSTTEPQSPPETQDPQTPPRGTAQSAQAQPVSLTPLGTGSFGGHVGIELQAKDIESVIVHIEDANERKLSKGIRFFLDKGQLSTRFFLYTPQHCGREFQRPLYVAAYYGGNTEKTPIPFAARNCTEPAPSRQPKTQTNEFQNANESNNHSAASEQTVAERTADRLENVSSGRTERQVSLPKRIARWLTGLF